MNRTLMKPFVWQPEDVETVACRVPISGPEEYFEMVLSPDEAEDFAFALWQDARRARYMREVNLRIARRRAKT